MFNKKRHRNRITCRKSPLIVLKQTLIKFIPVVTVAFFIIIFTDLIFFENYSLMIYKLICISFAAEALRNHYNNLYLIGQRRLITLTGILGLHYKRSSINYNDIREVKIKQSIFGRALKYGTLKIGTASTKSHEIIFKDVHNARELRKIIENIIHEKRKGVKRTNFDFRTKPKIKETTVVQN